MSGAPNSPLPLRCGLGLKSSHFADVLDAAVRGAGPHWVEIHPQNYMMDGGPMHRWLGAIAEHLPISMHSVALSLGDPAGVDHEELERLARLVDRYRPTMISDHLSWSSLDGERIPDLLPMPMTRATLDHFVAQAGVVQDRLGCQILLENPSRLVAFAADEYDEPAFLAELCRRSGCGLLFDINNVVVSAINLGFAPADYIDSIDPRIVGEIHVAGHTVEDLSGGLRVAIDDHGSAVGEQCWSLLERFLLRAGPKPVLVERDNEVPAFSEMSAEVKRADALIVQSYAYAS